MLLDILQWILIIVSIPILWLLIKQTQRRVRALNDRIDEYHEEQERAKQAPGPINPYADMAQIFGAAQNRAENTAQDNIEASSANYDNGEGKENSGSK